LIGSAIVVLGDGGAIVTGNELLSMISLSAEALDWLCERVFIVEIEWCSKRWSKYGGIYNLKIEN
jgi:hypothetical protein